MFLVLIGGGHAAGKRTVAHDLARAVAENGSNDSSNSQAQLKGTAPCPERLEIKVVDLNEYQIKRYEPAVDFPRLFKDLESVEKHTVVFIHGLYALYNEELNSQAKLRIYLDSDADVRLSQWILRDSHKRSLDEILKEYLDHCRPEFIQHIERTKPNADVFLPQGSENMTIELLAYDVRNSILKRLDAVPSRSTPTINLRAEAVSNMEDRYYATN